MQSDYALLTVALYTGLNGLILVWLSINVVNKRHALKISIGDGGDKEMARAMRGQANFVEYVPFCLILLLLMSLIGTPAWVLHLFGLTLTIARLLHAYHFISEKRAIWQRGWGTRLTFAVLGVGSVGMVAHAVFQMI